MKLTKRKRREEALYKELHDLSKLVDEYKFYTKVFQDTLNSKGSNVSKIKTLEENMKYLNERIKGDK